MDRIGRDCPPITSAHGPLSDNLLGLLFRAGDHIAADTDPVADFEAASVGSEQYRLLGRAVSVHRHHAILMIVFRLHTGPSATGLPSTTAWAWATSAGSVFWKCA